LNKNYETILLIANIKENAFMAEIEDTFWVLFSSVFQLPTNRHRHPTLNCNLAMQDIWQPGPWVTCKFSKLKT